MAFCRKFLAVSERLTAVLLCPTKEPWTKLEQLKPSIIKQCMWICVFLYVYIAFFLYVWKWSIKKKRNFYIDSFILCLPFLQILAFFWSTGPLCYYRVTSACTYRYVNLVSFMFSVSFFLASTNMLGSLCYKYVIILISQGVVRNKLNNSYKFLTWHRGDIQQMVILFFFPL